MKKIFNIISLLAVSAAILSGCKNEVLDTNQYADGGVVLNAYGPQPVMRGGELRFLGSNLDRVKEIIIPGVAPVTEINVVKSGVPSEIRIIVPKDGPEPGLLTLKTADGNEIVTKTPLSYSEPVVLDSFSPASVKAGDVLSIKGDYLNLIHEVIFSEDVKVSEKDFKKHDRYEIQLAVPVEARSGVIGIADLDESDPANADLLPNVIYAEDELQVAQPEVSSMTAARYIAGATVKISGKNFQYVAALNLPGAAGVEFSVNAGNSEITFVLPASAQDGQAVLVAKSGVEIVAGEYETVVPSGLSAAPAPVKAGAVLSISGKDLTLVSAIDLPGAAGVEFEGGEAIKLTMPESATEGDATLIMENGKSVAVAFTLVKPVFKAFSENPAAAGSNITISGSDLDLVKSVSFGGGLTVEVEAAESEIIVAVPTTAENGVVKLNLANGTGVDCEALTVNKPTACYITELPAAGTEIYGGTVLVVPVENEDKLESVEVNGESVKFLINGKSLYICLPDMAGKGTVIKLNSSNGAVEYTIDCIPNNIQKKVIWSGEFNAGGWAGNQDLAWGGFDWSSVDLSAGSVSLVFDFTEDSSQGWWQIALRHGNGWGDLPENTFFELTAGQTQLEVPLTQAMLDDLIANGGLVITGCNYILTKVTLKTEIPLETTIFEGPVSLTWGDDGRFGLATSYFEGLSAGSKLIFYFTQTENWGQVQINDGYWTALAFDELGGGTLNTDNVGGKDVTRFELTLTQAILDTILANKGDYFGLNTAYQGTGTVAFVIQGSDWIIEKITVL